MRPACEVEATHKLIRVLTELVDELLQLTCLLGAPIGRTVSLDARRLHCLVVFRSRALIRGAFGCLSLVRSLVLLDLTSRTSAVQFAREDIKRRKIS